MRPRPLKLVITRIIAGAHPRVGWYWCIVLEGRSGRSTVFGGGKGRFLRRNTTSSYQMCFAPTKENVRMRHCDG